MNMVRPGDRGWDAARGTFNLVIDQQPEAIAFPADAREVAAVIAGARERGLRVAAQATGHNPGPLGSLRDTVILNTSALTGVTIDAATRRVRVGAATRWEEVTPRLSELGLAALHGSSPDVGIVGYSLGGGIGWLARKHGMQANAVTAIELVTADGHLVRTDPSREPELFWALRGGGGNFGVVTEFVFRLHQVGPQITGGAMAWSAEHAEAVLDAFRVTTDRASSNLTLAAIRRNAPPAPWLPESAHGRPVVMVVACHSGSAEEAAADLAGLRAVGEPLADIVMEKEYVAQQSMLDATQPKGMHYYWKSEFVPGLSDDLLATYHAQFEGLMAPASQVVLFHLAGAPNERPEDDGAFGNREAAFACVVQSMGAPDLPPGENRAWVRSAWEALRPFSTGGNYINFQTDDEPDSRTVDSYRSNYDRLRAAKQRYDPQNLFRVNRNIR